MNLKPSRVISINACIFRPLLPHVPEPHASCIPVFRKETSLLTRLENHQTVS